MHLSLKELQEVNKDVLMGKKRLDCLSCGHDKKNDVNNVIGKMGQDGKMYRATTAVT